VAKILDTGGAGFIGTAVVRHLRCGGAGALSNYGHYLLRLAGEE